MKRSQNYWIEKSGLKEVLPELLKTRVYIGISAGSMVPGPNMFASQSKRLYYENKELGPDMEALKFVDFYVKPHLNSPFFPNVRDGELKKMRKELDGDLYGLDDESGVQVSNGEVTVISEGVWKKY